MKQIIAILTIALALIVVGCAPQQQNISSFEECVEAGNPVMESYPRQCSTGNQTFTEQLSLQEQCENINSGTWIESAQECEGINESTCTQLEGEFNSCASACRNDPNASVCTLQCVQVCSFN